MLHAVLCHDDCGIPAIPMFHSHLGAPQLVRCLAMQIFFVNFACTHHYCAHARPQATSAKGKYIGTAGSQINRHGSLPRCGPVIRHRERTYFFSRCCSTECEARGSLLALAGQWQPARSCQSVPPVAASSRLLLCSAC